MAAPPALTLPECFWSPHSFHLSGPVRETVRTIFEAVFKSPLGVRVENPDDWSVNFLPKNGNWLIEGILYSCFEPTRFTITFWTYESKDIVVQLQCTYGNRRAFCVFGKFLHQCLTSSPPVHSNHIAEGVDLRAAPFLIEMIQKGDPCVQRQGWRDTARCVAKNAGIPETRLMLLSKLQNGKTLWWNMQSMVLDKAVCDDIVRYALVCLTFGLQSMVSYMQPFWIRLVRHAPRFLQTNSTASLETIYWFLKLLHEGMSTGNVLFARQSMVDLYRWLVLFRPKMLMGNIRLKKALRNKNIPDPLLPLAAEILHLLKKKHKKNKASQQKYQVLTEKGTN